MGICSSCDSTAVATAKLILEDGRLQEFSDPVRVSQILARNPSCFICKADDMAFDAYISAMNDDDNLDIGHLYFVLPLSWLNSPLSAQDLAALASKACLALKMSGGGGGKCCGCVLSRKVDRIEFISKEGEEDVPMVATGGDNGGCSGGFVANTRARGRRSGVVGGGERRSMTKLNVILEEE